MSGLRADLDLPPIHGSSAVSLVHERIRRLILSGDIPAGTRLGQADLADRLGVSRTPVREALRRLVGDGLVEFRDHRGFRVAESRLDDVVRRLEVRLILEPGAALLAAQRATDEDVAALEAAIEGEARAGDAGDVHDASRAFHVLLAAATHNRELVAALERVWPIEIGRRLAVGGGAGPPRRDCEVAEHRELLAMLRVGDGASAAQLTEKHLRRAWQRREREARAATA